MTTLPIKAETGDLQQPDSLESGEGGLGFRVSGLGSLGAGFRV